MSPGGLALSRYHIRVPSKHRGTYDTVPREENQTHQASAPVRLWSLMPCASSGLRATATSMVGHPEQKSAVALGPFRMGQTLLQAPTLHSYRPLRAITSASVCFLAALFNALYTGLSTRLIPVTCRKVECSGNRMRSPVLRALFCQAFCSSWSSDFSRHHVHVMTLNACYIV